MSEQNQTQETGYLSNLAKVNNAYLPMIQDQLESKGIDFNDYSKKCVMNAIGSINIMLDNAGLTFGSQDLDQSNITNILLDIAFYELNPIAQPRECYFQLRTVKKKDGSFKKVIEMGIEGDGNDAILARFGRDVKKVYPHWLVRSGDHFEYPKYKGVQMTEPIWEPTGQGEVVRVVYPVLHTDNTIHYYIGEKADVMKNLLAHINNNLMNETFGFVTGTKKQGGKDVPRTRYDATPEELAKINSKKAELKAKAKELGFAVLDDKEFAAYISPSWKEDFSRESMFIRKMRNNVVTKIPKRFSNPFICERYDELTMEGYENTKQAIEDRNAIIDVEPIEVAEGVEAPQNESQEPGGSLNRGNEEKAPQGESTASDGDVENRAKPNFG